MRGTGPVRHRAQLRGQAGRPPAAACVRGAAPAGGRAERALSFPSAHTTSSFACAVAITRLVPELARPLFALATLIALGRPYLGMHYPSDVLGGATLGAALGLAVPLGAGLLIGLVP